MYQMEIKEQKSHFNEIIKNLEKSLEETK